MKKLLVATHGHMASGIVSSLKLITSERVDVIDAYVDDHNFEKDLDEYLETIKSSDTLIVMTDLYGGSVNQTLLWKLNLSKHYLITGINLALLIEVAMMSEKDITEASLKHIVEQAKEQMMVMELPNDEHDDFNF